MKIILDEELQSLLQLSFFPSGFENTCDVFE